MDAILQQTNHIKTIDIRQRIQICCHVPDVSRELTSWKWNWRPRKKTAPALPRALIMRSPLDHILVIKDVLARKSNHAERFLKWICSSITFKYNRKNSYSVFLGSLAKKRWGEPKFQASFLHESNATSYRQQDLRARWSCWQGTEGRLWQI